MTAPVFYKIGAVTVGSGGSTEINFTSIPQIYSHLLIKTSIRDTAATFSENIRLRFNGVSTSSYTDRLLRGTGSTVASFYNASDTQIGWWYSSAASSTTSTFSSNEIFIPNYTSTVNKSIGIDTVTENNATDAYPSINASIFTTSSAITSIKILSHVFASFVQYSSATLYGIK